MKPKHGDCHEYSKEDNKNRNAFLSEYDKIGYSVPVTLTHY